MTYIALFYQIACISKRLLPCLYYTADSHLSRAIFRTLKAGIPRLDLEIACLSLFCLQQALDALLYLVDICCRLKAGNDVSVTVYYKLREVPLDIRLLVPVRIRFGKHLLEQRLVLMLLESLKALL